MQADERFKRAAQSVAGSDTVPSKLALGIRYNKNCQPRIFPHAIQELWRASEIRDEDVPSLLYRIEGRLWAIEYPCSASATITRYMLRINGALVASVIMLFALFGPEGGRENPNVALAGAALVAFIVLAATAGWSLVLRLRRGKLNAECRNFLKDLSFHAGVEHN
jgi:hypothetical protein